MNSEVWATIIGVLVGAILPYGAQRSFARQQRADELARDLRGIQRDIYSRFLAAVHQATRAASDGLPESSSDAHAELRECVALVGLVSPRDTWEAAVRLSDAASPSAPDGAATNGGRDEASAAFVELARRDVGFAGHDDGHSQRG